MPQDIATKRTTFLPPSTPSSLSCRAGGRGSFSGRHQGVIEVGQPYIYNHVAAINNQICDPDCASDAEQGLKKNLEPRVVYVKKAKTYGKVNIKSWRRLRSKKIDFISTDFFLASLLNFQVSGFLVTRGLSTIHGPKSPQLNPTHIKVGNQST